MVRKTPDSSLAVVWGPCLPCDCCWVLCLHLHSLPASTLLWDCGEGQGSLLERAKQSHVGLPGDGKAASGPGPACPGGTSLDCLTWVCGGGRSEKSQH